MMKNVALLEPSVASECVVSEMTGQIRCGSPFLAGSLARHGFEARVFAEELIVFDAALMDRISRDYDAVGISAALNTLPRALQVVRALKRRRPSLPIAVGGPSASAFADRLLHCSPEHVNDQQLDLPRMPGPQPFLGCDAVFRGRAETSFPTWLKTIFAKDAPSKNVPSIQRSGDWPSRGDTPRNDTQSMAFSGYTPHRGDTWAEIPGIVFRSGQNLVINRNQPEIADGETRYDLVEGFGPQTVREGLFGLRKPAVYTLFASTGCVRQCRFCQSEKTYLRRDHGLVIADLERILKLHGTQNSARLMIVDDCFFGDLDWTKELLRRIEHATRGYKVSFSVQFHVQPTADDELMMLFKKAHFTSLALGFESTSAAALDSQHKGTTPQQNDAAIDQCRRFGIVPYGYFVVGFDTDSEETVRSVFEYILHRKLIAQVLPVGLMNRDEWGNPTPDASRIFSDTSFGATIFVSHQPRNIKPSLLQRRINQGHRKIFALRRIKDFSTSYERQFLFAQSRCLNVWYPAMERHVDVLRRIET